MTIDEFIDKIEIKNAALRKSKYQASITKIADNLIPEFNGDEVSAMLVEKHFNNPESKYYQMTQDQILSQWAEKGQKGMSLGRNVDDFIGTILESHDGTDKIEEVFNRLKSKTEYDGNKPGNPMYDDYIDLIKGKLDSFHRFYNENIKGVLEYVDSEQWIMNPDYGYRGRYDAMFALLGTIEGSGNPPNTDILSLVLIDWKNDEDLPEYNKYEKMYGPLRRYDNTKLNKYSMQVYLYKYALETVYEIDIPIIPLIVQLSHTHFAVHNPKIPYSQDLMHSVLEYYYKVE